MDTIPQEDAPPLSDSALIEAVRGGGEGAADAYEELYRRHVDAARRMAREMAGSDAGADDLVQEAFARILALLRDGRGPTEAFRPYLLTAVKRVEYDRAKKEGRVQAVADMETVPNIELPFRDTAVEGEEQRRIVAAFNRLDERHQAVLWHTEIEGEKPAQVAPILGIAANAVAALARRARRALALAYLDAHLGSLDRHEEGCRAYVAQLAAWTRGDLGRRAKQPVDEHVESCSRCTALAAELATINATLITTVGPMVTGAAAAGYLPAAVTTTAGGSGAAAWVTPRNAAIGGGVAVAAALAAILIALASEHGNPPVPVVAAPRPPAVKPRPSPVPAPVAASPPPAAPPAPATRSPAAAAPSSTRPVLGLPLPLPTAPASSEPVIVAEPEVSVGVGVAELGVRVHADLWDTGRVDASVAISGGLMKPR